MPNIQLNIFICWVSKSQKYYILLFFALLNTILQLSILLVLGITVYNEILFSRIEKSNTIYSFSLFLTSTIFLVVDILICSYIIEQNTIERLQSQIGNNRSKFDIIQLQKKQSVSNQSFDLFLIVGHKSNNQVIISIRIDPNSKDINLDDGIFATQMLILSRAVLRLVGFFLQF